MTHSGTGGGGSPEAGDFGLAQHLGELGHTLVSDVVVVETVSEEQSGYGEKASVSWGADAKASTRAAAHDSEMTALPLRPSHNLEMPSTV